MKSEKPSKGRGNMSPFGGDPIAVEQNALFKTFHDCADDHNQDIYDYLEDCPRASMVVNLVDKLHENGFKIIKKND